MESGGPMMDRPLNIAMLCLHTCPLGQPGARDAGGMNVYIKELARELGRRGHRVDVFTRGHGPDHQPITSLGRDIRLIHLPAGKNESLPKTDLHPLLPEFFRSLEEFRRREGLAYDLIHSHYWLSGLAGQMAAESWNAPHLIMFHTLGHVKNAASAENDEPELRLVSETELAAGCDRIIAATPREKQELSLYYGASPDRIGVIPCGVNLELFRPVSKALARHECGFNPADKIILFVGRLDPLKNLDRLFQAVARLIGHYKFKLVIVGGDDSYQPEITRLSRLAETLGLGDSVFFTGSIAQVRLPFYYRAADVFVLPSFHESFGLAALEALACGTPVAAGKIGGLEDIIVPGRNGWLTEDHSPDSLADKIGLALARPEPDSVETEFIRDTVARYSWSNIAEAVLDEYRATLEITATPDRPVTPGRTAAWTQKPDAPVFSIK